MPIGTFAQVALDCANPRELAEFYRLICGGEIDESRSDDGWVHLVTPEGSNIGCQLDPHHEPPGWPSAPAQQAHIDILVEDLEAGEAAVLAIGAVKTDLQPCPAHWRVFLDPAGHPFCLVDD